ncbi:MAG: metalloregulator ArsR/SmtB family transcription factor [Candidatus Krumholzibacteria bacterium]|nr:metalloregulator ArsR/SmtB family transcription factor [Candidatus Krumholzibacteria bacterium]
MPSQFDSATIERIARRLKALADASRLSMIHCLCDGERSVTELVERTGLGQANVSKHLRILREEGFVLSRRSSRNVYYRVSDSLPEDICMIVCKSMKEKAAGDRRLLERYMDRKRSRRAG